MKIFKLVMLISFLFNSAAYPCENASNTLRPPMLGDKVNKVRLESAGKLAFGHNIKSPSVDAKTVAGITSWLIGNIEKATEAELDGVLPVLAEHLKGLKASGLAIEDKDIDDVIKGIRLDKGKLRKEWKTVKFFKGELADIVDGKDSEITVTEIGFAHILGLKHRTANAFVMTPHGKLLIQRRAPGRKYPLYLSIFGGHLKAGQDYEEGIKEELVQELHLPEGTELKSRIGFLNKEDYDETGIANKEFRGLYVYQLTQEEYAKVMEYSKGLEEEKAKRTEDGFEAWLSDSDAKKRGFGEVWGYYEIDVGGIEGAGEERTRVADDKRDMDLHYLKVTDTFKDGSKTGKAYFTPDLLERIVRKNEIIATMANTQVNIQNYMDRLANLWEYSKTRKFNNIQEFNPPYDKDKGWKPIYGISSIFWVEPTVIQEAQDALKNALRASILEKIKWLDPKTGHITIVGFNVKESELDESAIDRELGLSNEILAKSLRSPITFNASGVSMMPNGALIIPMIPDVEGLAVLDKVYKEHRELAPEEVIKYPSYIAHASLGYIYDTLSDEETKILVRAIEELSGRNFSSLTAEKADLYYFHDISFSNGTELNTYNTAPKLASGHNMKPPSAGEIYKDLQKTRNQV